MATNSSNQIDPAWMDETWHVSQADPGNSFGVVGTDTVTFTGMTVMMQHNIPGVTTSAQPWGTLDTVTATQATGHTSQEGTPFQIIFDANLNQLTCGLTDTSPRIPWSAVALGMIVGTLLGGATGFAIGSLRLGALAGLVATTAGSLVTARVIPTHSDYHPVQGGGSNPTWVAGDPTGGRVGKPGPHSVVRATA